MSLPCIEQLLKLDGVQTSECHQCQYGAQVAHGKYKGDPLRKATRFMSNSPEILSSLSRVCSGKDGWCSRPGGGRHRRCCGRIAKEAAIYPKGICRAILYGLKRQLSVDGKFKVGCYGLQAPDDEPEIVRQLYGPDQGYSGRFRDATTGQVLKDELVIEARRKELEYFNQKGVWIKVPKGKARQLTGRPPITVKWVDVNKGDEGDPNYRSRLVARQIKAKDFSEDNDFQNGIISLSSVPFSVHLKCRSYS